MSFGLRGQLVRQGCGLLDAEIAEGPFKMAIDVNWAVNFCHRRPRYTMKSPGSSGKEKMPNNGGRPAFLVGWLAVF